MIKLEDIIRINSVIDHYDDVVVCSIPSIKGLVVQANSKEEALQELEKSLIVLIAHDYNLIIN